MPPPPLDADAEMAKVVAGDTDPQMQMGMGMQPRRAIVNFRMEYCDQISRPLVEKGVCPVTT